MIKGVGRLKRLNRSYQNGIGYIVIPFDEDRSKFISTCYRKEKVAIQLDFGGGIIRDCFVLTHVMREIKFPEESGRLGSCVAFIGDEYHSSPTIIGVISKREESQLLEENVVKRSVYSDQAHVNTESDGNGGNMYVSVDSKFENGGKIKINLNSKNNTAELDVKCFGDINVYSEGETSLETLKTTNIQCFYIDSGIKKTASKLILSQEGFAYEDKNGNKIEVKGEEVNIIPKTKLNVFSGGSPMVKGDELKSQLETLSSRVTGIINALNSAPMSGKELLAYGGAIKLAMTMLPESESFDDINSVKSFLD